jgi:hypothetical protein
MIVIRREAQPTLIHVPGKCLGRNINWDPRSKRYRVARITTAPVTQFWTATNDDALNQLELGACTGFSTAQCLNCAPFSLKLTDVEAKNMYHLATINDSFAGIWPPTDTGSDTLSVMKAAKSLGYITSYSHCFNLDDVIHGLQSGPGIAGIDWYEGYDNPDPITGMVEAKGNVRGGHEITIEGCNLEECYIDLRTSWGPDFGVTYKKVNGIFRMSFTQAQAALFTNGDAAFPTK